MTIYVPSSTIWREWTSYTTTGTSATTTDIFSIWCDSTASTGTSTVWADWVSEYTTIQIDRAEQLRHEVERQQAMQQFRERANLEYVERQKKQLQAKRKAKMLLLENLDMEQFKDFHKEGHFFVKSPSGRLYRIREGRSINIDLMKGNSRIEVEKRLCAHPDVICPNEDTMLAQKIYLEHMEQQFLQIANQYDPVRH